MIMMLWLAKIGDDSITNIEWNKTKHNPKDTILHHNHPPPHWFPHRSHNTGPPRAETICHGKNQDLDNQNRS